MKIRWSVLLGIVLLGLVLAGCSDRPSNTADEQPDSTPVEETVVDASPEEAAPREESAVETEIAAGGLEDPSSAEIVATANGVPVYRDEYESAKSAIVNQNAMTYAQLGMDYGALLEGGDGRLRELSIEAEAMYRVFGVVLAEAEADARGILPTNDTIDTLFEAQYAQILDAQRMTEAELDAYLVSQGSSLEEFKVLGREAVTWQLTIDALAEDLTATIEISEQDLQRYLDEHIDEYATPEEVRASHIHFGTTDTHLSDYLASHEDEYAEADTGELPAIDDVRDELVAAIRAEAEAALAKIRGGASFDDLASARMDTDAISLGWFAETSLGETFDAAAFTLDIGEVSDLVETEIGYHIIRLDDRRQAHTPKLDEVIDDVRLALDEQIRSEQLEAFMANAYDTAQFEIHLPLLDAVWGQQMNPDGTIGKLERLVEEGLPGEPYLGYVLAAMYELRIEELSGEKLLLEAEEDPAEEVAQQIAELDRQISQDIERAIAAYELALQAVGDDPAIQAKLDSLEEQLGDGKDEPEEAQGDGD